MDKNYLVAIASIVFIVAITSSFIKGAQFSDSPALNIAGQAVYFEATTVAPQTSQSVLENVQLHSNSGMLQAHSTLITNGKIITYTAQGASESGTMEGFSVELANSQRASVADFRVAHSLTSDSANPNGGFELVASRAQDGTWYTFVSAEQLSTLKNKFGSGWFVFFAQAHSANGESETQSIAFFIE